MSTNLNENIIKLQPIMKVRKPNVLKQLYAKFVTQARKKDMV